MQQFAIKKAVFILFFLTVAVFSYAQNVNEPKETPPDWSKPYQPFRIVGNLYYVGTYDLASYLITTAQGNILINTGLAASAEQIKNNIEKLGFKFIDIKILLITHAHFDHVGAVAEIKKKTGAKLMVNAADAQVMSDGGQSDYEVGGKGATFNPVAPDRLLKDGDTVRLGDAQFIMLHHPGHTKGSNSFVFNVTDQQKTFRVLIANMPSIITSKRFADISTYTDIAKDYAYTFNAMKNISFDIWLSSHASQFNLHEKYKTGDKYQPSVFIDQKGYDAALGDLKKKYDEKTKKDADRSE
jgi:metallo-beta-lactamase class B